MFGKVKPVYWLIKVRRTARVILLSANYFIKCDVTKCQLSLKFTQLNFVCFKARVRTASR